MVEYLNLAVFTVVTFLERTNTWRVHINESEPKHLTQDFAISDFTIARVVGILANHQQLNTSVVDFCF